MGMFVHMVLLEIPSDTKEELITEIFTELEGLENIIDGLLSFSGGPYSSPEGLNKGFTHGFTMIFESEEKRNAYFPHPAHEAVKNKLLAVITNVVAFDYEKQN